MSVHVSETFKFCPRCSTQSSSVGQIPFKCAECDFGFYFSPATAVGGIITNGDDVLLLKRARDPGKGKFGLPGGFVDAGETLEDSLIREVREETSLAVTRTDYLCSFPNSYTYQGVTVDVLDAFYVCEVASFEDRVVEPNEVQSFQIGPITDEVIANMAFESNQKALRLYLDRS